MKKTIWIGTLALALVLASACGRDELTQAADDVADTTADVAAGAAEAAGDAAQAAAARVGSVAAEPDPVEACRSAAGASDWAGALEVCRRAHELKPDDLAIEHALQQAEAAAAE